MEKTLSITKNEELPYKVQQEMKLFNYHFTIGEFSQNGWDGHDALPIEAESVLKTFEFIENLYLWLKIQANVNMPCPMILPGVNGGCILSWAEEMKLRLRLVICINKQKESYLFNYYGKIHDPILDIKLFEIKKNFKPLNIYKQVDFVNLFKMSLQ